MPAQTRFGRRLKQQENTARMILEVQISGAVMAASFWNGGKPPTHDEVCDALDRINDKIKRDLKRGVFDCIIQNTPLLSPEANYDPDIVAGFKQYDL